MKYKEVLTYIKNGHIASRQKWNGAYIFMGSHKDRRSIIKFNANSNIKHTRYIPSIGDVFAKDWEVIK